MGEFEGLDSGVGAERAPLRDRALIKKRILEAFSQRARRRGLRAVVMIELARDLGMSSRTLYQHYPSKAELVRAMVGDWMHQFGQLQEQRLDSDEKMLDRILVALGGWLEFTSTIHAGFFEELQRDYPEANRLYIDQIDRQVRAGRSLLEGSLRPGLESDLVFGHLLASVVFAADSERCERMGITRLQAVVQVVNIWARGALRDGALGA